MIVAKIEQGICDLNLDGSVRLITAETCELINCIYNSIRRLHPQDAEMYRSVITTVIAQYGDNVFAQRSAASGTGFVITGRGKEEKDGRKGGI